MHYSRLAPVKACPWLVLRLPCMDPRSDTHALAPLALPALVDSALVLLCPEHDHVRLPLSLPVPFRYHSVLLVIDGP